MRKRLRLSQRQQRIVAAVEALGWASGPLLAFLDGAGMDERNYYTEKYLPRLVRQGKLWARDWGRERIYRLPAYGTGRNPNIEHALAAGWVAARLVRAAGLSPDLLVPRRVFVQNGIGCVPDAALILPAANGRHLFLIEYQSAREAERTTGAKVEAYKTSVDTMRQELGMAGVWVLFILAVPQQRAQQIAHRHGDMWTLFFFCDHETFLAQEWHTIWQAPIFFCGNNASGQALLPAERHV